MHGFYLCISLEEIPIFFTLASILPEPYQPCCIGNKSAYIIEIVKSLESKWSSYKWQSIPSFIFLAEPTLFQSFIDYNSGFMITNHHTFCHPENALKVTTDRTLSSILPMYIQLSTSDLSCLAQVSNVIIELNNNQLKICYSNYASRNSIMYQKTANVDSLAAKNVLTLG